MKDSKEDIIELCKQLTEATKLKKNGRCIKSSHTANNTTIAVDSWKFQDWDYGKDKIKLPIQARGLFTTNDDTIVVRGYDKFFNVNEKASTKEENLKSMTTGPYEVTLKENGCIVFISGLSTGDIIVCSKHSTGKRDQDTTRNHALAGEEAVKKQLGNDESKVKELAKYLYENNLTAIAELCDDEFEEHVLAYPKEKAGLYLHGLNYNTIQFRTLSMKDVYEFGDAWNFKAVKSLKFEDVNELFDFLHKCSETGKYNDQEVEGFVIRCKDSSHHDFFFKYKFEEPYLLYRQFREVTRELISNKVPIHSIRMKKHKYITKKYLEFVDELFKKEPDLAENFRHGHGIIKVRELFLQHLQETNGMDLLTLDAKLTDEMQKLNLEENVKYVFVPIATIGCGKTTVFNSLANLFPDWIHIQNDNISKNSKLKIVDLTLKALDNNPVVLFDRNNAEYRERTQLFTSMAQKRDQYIDPVIQIKYIALNFIHDIDEEQLWDLTFKRIKDRGDNHQSIKSDSDENVAINVMQGFIKRFKPFDATRKPDCDFDHVIHLKLSNEDSSFENVKIIIDDIFKNFKGIINEKPTDEEIHKLFKLALEYKPTFTKDMSLERKKKDPSYFGIAIDHPSLVDTIDQLLAGNESWIALKEANRIQEEFHVTLGHVLTSKLNDTLRKKWKELAKRFILTNEETKAVHAPGKNLLDFYADVKLTQVVANKQKLICVKVELLDVFDSDFNKLEKVECLNTHLHITVGTFAPEIKPMKSNQTLTGLYKDSPEVRPDGEYSLKNDEEEGQEEIEVVNFKKDVVFEKQRLFAFY